VGGGGCVSRAKLLYSRWPLHDIAIANIVWCMAYRSGGRKVAVYCAMGVQYNCSRVGFAGGEGQ